MKKLFALLLIPILGCTTSLPKLIEKTEPKVVKIGVVYADGGESICSGAVISKTGSVLTCAHCFSHHGITKVFIKTWDERSYRVELLKIDAEKDLALIAPRTDDIFDFFKFGVTPEKGQQVLSFGSPLGLQHTATIGWVDNLVKQTNRFIFHSAFISPGNSGGPLVDLHGRLIGVNEAMMGYGFLQVAQGLFIAIDITTVQDFLNE